MTLKYQCLWLKGLISYYIGDAKVGHMNTLSALIQSGFGLWVNGSLTQSTVRTWQCQQTFLQIYHHVSSPLFCPAMLVSWVYNLQHKVKTEFSILESNGLGVHAVSTVITGNKNSSFFCFLAWKTELLIAQRINTYINTYRVLRTSVTMLLLLHVC